MKHEIFTLIIFRTFFGFMHTSFAMDSTHKKLPALTVKKPKISSASETALFVKIIKPDQWLYDSICKNTKIHQLSFFSGAQLIFKKSVENNSIVIVSKDAVDLSENSFDITLTKKLPTICGIIKLSSHAPYFNVYKFEPLQKIPHIKIIGISSSKKNQNNLQEKDTQITDDELLLAWKKTENKNDKIYVTDTTINETFYCTCDGILRNWKLSPQKNYIAFIEEENDRGIVLLQVLREKKGTKKFLREKNNLRKHTLVFSACSTMLFAGTNEPCPNFIFVWNTQTGELLYQLRGLLDSIISISPCPETKYVLASSMTQEILLWKLPLSYFAALKNALYTHSNLHDVTFRFFS